MTLTCRVTQKLRLSVGVCDPVPVALKVARARSRTRPAHRRGMSRGPHGHSTPGRSIVRHNVAVSLELREDVVVELGEDGVDAHIQAIRLVAD